MFVSAVESQRSLYYTLSRESPGGSRQSKLRRIMMKKLVALFLSMIMIMAAVSALADNIKMDKLTLEFVPSKDADVIITGTKNLPDLLKAEMANQGYDIGKVEITVGTNYNATGEAMGAGSIDVGWLPAGTYILYSDETDVILTRCNLPC